jgi:hypothetical protein
MENINNHKSSMSMVIADKSESREELLARVRQAYSIPGRFPIELTEGSPKFYSGEHARIEYIHDERNVIRGARVHSAGKFYESLMFHELGHLKMRFMAVPVFMARPNDPPWFQMLLVAHDEYYAQLVNDRVAPSIGLAHHLEGNDNLPSVKDLTIQLKHIPPEGTEAFYQAFGSITLGEVSRLVCMRSRNLRQAMGPLEVRSRVIRESTLRGYVDGIFGALLRLPPLPAKRFSASECDRVTSAVNGLMKAIFGPGVPRLTPANYSFNH